MLNFPNPAAFTQALRMRRRALPSNAALVVVEGATDKRAIFPFILPSCFVVPAGGKDRLINAFESLESDLLEKIVFILDCDGSTPNRLKGKPGLVLTSNRDLEADLLFELRSLNRVVAEYFADKVSTPASLPVIIKQIQKEVADVTKSLGIIRWAATEAGARVRLRDVGRRNPRKISLYDLDAVRDGIGSGTAVSLRLIVEEMTNKLEWNHGQKMNVLVRCKSLEEVECNKHDQPACESCSFRKYCNGHDIVDALAICISRRLGKSVDSKEIDKMLRISSDRKFLANWEVFKRIQNWEVNSSLRVFDTV